MKRCIAAATLLSLLGSTGAGASPPGATPVDPLLDPAGPVDQAPARIRYHDQTLLVDSLSLGLLLGGFAAEGDNGRDTEASETLMTAGLMGGFFGAPIVHIVRGNAGGAALSFLVRATLPGITAAIAIETADCEDSREWLCGLDRLGPGIAVGLAGSAVIDAVFFAVQDAPPEPVRAASWAPQLQLGRERATVGFAAAF